MLKDAKVNFPEVVRLVRERLVLLTDFDEQADLFYHNPESFDPKMSKKKWRQEDEKWYQSMQKFISGVDFNAQLEENLQELDY